jgi:hypothetical protein
MTPSQTPHIVQEDAMPCTCHRDDNPPVPCARKYALSDCRLSALSGALERQTDTLAFILNHVALPDQWYEKFTIQLNEDRKVLLAARVQDMSTWVREG